MNGQMLYEDFEKRYGKEKGEIVVYQAASPLMLFGSELARFHLPALGIGIAPPSMLALRTRSDGLFRIQTVHSNEEAFCRKENLGNYHGNAFYQKIFSMLQTLPPTLSGADMLFYEQGDLELFSHAASACALAFWEETESEKLLTALGEEDAACRTQTLVSLCAERNQALLLQDTQISKLPFCAEHEKIILITVEMKRKPEFSLDGIETLKELSVAAEHNQYAAFLLREAKRTGSAVRMIEHGKEKNLRILLEDSTKDFLETAGKEAQNLKTLYKLAAPHSNGCKAVGGIGLFCFVPNANTDQFLDLVHHAYQKKAGTPPAFYIGEMLESGKISDIKTE